MAVVATLSEVLVSLEAKTPRELTRLMFENNIKNSKMFLYTTPSFQNGKWVVWYANNLMTDPEFAEFQI